MHTQPLGPGTKANFRDRRDWRYYGLALGVLCLLGVPARAQSCSSNPSCQPQFNLNGYEKDVKTVITDCTTNTSSSSCAWADAIGVTNPTDFKTYFLACSLRRTGPIALCYYSGMPGKSFYTPSCTFSQNKNAAECDCYVIDENTPGAGTNPYSFVLITGILNKQVYETTVAQCGSDGSGCLNMTDTSAHLPEAPVCDDLRNKTFYSGADLISDFSQIPIPQIAAAGFPPPGDPGSFSQACPTSGNSDIYAGCMTAPCKGTGKTDPTTGFPIAKCTCPTYNGPDQIGNPQIQSYSCSIAPHVWSAAFQEITH